MSVVAVSLGMPATVEQPAARARNSRSPPKALVEFGLTGYELRSGIAMSTRQLADDSDLLWIMLLYEHSGNHFPETWASLRGPG